MILSCPKKPKIILIYNYEIARLSPSKNSSRTTFLEDLNFPLNIFLVISSTCFLVLQIETPLPAARPSAFTTNGKLHFFKYFNICFFLNKFYILLLEFYIFEQIFFMKALDPSSLEAYLFGPKTLILFFLKKSTMPLTNGASGPTITSPIL